MTAPKKNTAENGKVFLFADTLFNNENPHVSCRKCNISVSYVAKKNHGWNYKKRKCAGR